MNDALGSRRDFIRAAAAGGGSIALGLTAASQVNARQDEKPVRKNVQGLTADGLALKAYRKAIAAMKGRDRNTQDPLSWTFQANMHDAPPGQAHAHWGWCMHGNWWFLPWHRGYLYFFERIVRKLSGEPSFALPYWKWEEPGQEALPDPFRRPVVGTETNHLFDGTRFRTVNSGTRLDDQDRGFFATTAARALRQRTFMPSRASVKGFGGVRVPLPAGRGKPQSTRKHSELEAAPHDEVHVRTAPENGGNMADPRTAARDPIFWLHHANIDRLWSRWLDDTAHENPSDGDWRKQEFPFYDENGTLNWLSVDDILRTTADAYRYDDDPQPVKVGKALQPRPEAFRQMEPPKLTPVAAALPMFELGHTPLRQKLTFEEGARTTVAQAVAAQASPDAPPTRVVLKVEGVRPPENPKVSYAVYVYPAGKPQEDNDHLVGSFSFFGKGAGHDHGSDKQYDEIFDATDVIDLIRRASRNQVPDLEVGIVPRSNDPGVSAKALEKITPAKVVFSKILLQLPTDASK